MSTDSPDPIIPDNMPDDLVFCIIAATYNHELVDQLTQRTIETLMEHGVSEENIDFIRVPGSNEIPYIANIQGLSGQYDCLIALGVIVAGDTKHDEIIANSTANAMHGISMTTEIPVINGIIHTETREQAEARVGSQIDRGSEFAHAAILMATHKRTLLARLDEIEARERIQRGKPENN